MTARVGRYIVVGLASTGVDVGLVYGLLSLGSDYRVAVTAGYVAALVVNYVLHAYYTFEADQLSVPQAARFGGLVVLNYLLTLAIVWLFKEPLGQSAMIGKLASVPVIALTGYFLGKAWVFARPR